MSGSYIGRNPQYGFFEKQRITTANGVLTAFNLAFDTTLISASATPFIGIPLVLGKAFLFRGARKDKEMVRYLKAQLEKSKKTQKIWERQVSRRDFLKGLTIASAGLSRLKK